MTLGNRPVQAVVFALITDELPPFILLDLLASRLNLLEVLLFGISHSTRSAAIAINSSLPMRRARISSAPAAVLKYHWPEEFCCRGIGNGKILNPDIKHLAARF